MFFPLGLRCFVVATVISSLMFVSIGAAEDEDVIFEIGTDITLSCPNKKRLGNEDDLMKWNEGRLAIFEDEGVLAGAPDRYEVALTADEYQLTMQSLTAKDDGKKLSCVYDNAVDAVTVKTFRLRLKVMTTTPPPPPEPTEPAVEEEEEVVTEASKPVPTKAGRVDTKDSDSKTQVDKKTTDLSGKEGGGGGGGGAPSLTTSSGLAAILITLYALQL